MFSQGDLREELDEALSLLRRMRRWHSSSSATSEQRLMNEVDKFIEHHRPRKVVAPKGELATMVNKAAERSRSKSA